MIYEERERARKFFPILGLFGAALGCGIISLINSSVSQPTQSSEATPTLVSPPCRIIGPGDNAFEVWKELGMPPVVDFYNLVGPDATDKPSTRRINDPTHPKEFLPNPVQPGDQLGPVSCIPAINGQGKSLEKNQLASLNHRGFSPSRNSVSAPRAYKGFRTF